MSKKRIGILTFHTSINNGAVMQCYALSKRLQKEFPDATVEVIDYRMPKIERHYDTSLLGCFNGGSLTTQLKRFVLGVLNYRKNAWLKTRSAVFKSVLHMLPLSEKIVSDDSSPLFAYLNNKYDAVIAGSDAIWNYSVRGFPNPYFLDDSLACKKFSYAASCYGMSYEKIPVSQKNRIKEILESYRFLGTRDGESEKFLQQTGCMKPPIHTCDPTVFLDVNDLPIDEAQLKTKLQSKGFDFTRPTIGIMGNDKMCDMVRSLYGDTYQIAALYNYCKDADVNLYDLTPYEWAYVFRHFKITFTIFFHGTLVSLRNGTPVLCIERETDYSKNYMTKVEDFLRRVGLEDCYFSTDYKTKNIDKIKAKVDELLSKDCKADICARMDKEAISCQPFIDALRTALYEE